jgi:hypothetical protein
MLKEDPEVLGVLDELQDVDDYLPSTSIGHHPLDLPHLMEPKLPQIVVGWSTSLAPELEATLEPRALVQNLELG